MFHKPILSINFKTTLPIDQKGLENEYKHLYKDFLSDSSTYIQLGYIFINEKQEPIRSSHHPIFYPLTDYMRFNQPFSIHRSDIPFTPNVRLACHIQKRETNKKYIDPIIPLLPIELDKKIRPYDFFIKKPKTSFSGPFTIESHWKKLIKVYHHAQKTQSKEIRKIDKQANKSNTTKQKTKRN